MAHVIWEHSPPTTWVGTVEGQPVCSIQRKDIGGWTAVWMDERLWPAPAHLPKAQPQSARFFSELEEAQQAVAQALLSG